MTATITAVTLRIVDLSGYGALTTGIGVIGLMLLIILLVEQVLLQAYGGEQYPRRASSLNVAIMPLLILLVLFIFLRFAQLLDWF